MWQDGTFPGILYVMVAEHKHQDAHLCHLVYRVYTANAYAYFEGMVHPA